MDAPELIELEQAKARFVELALAEEVGDAQCRHFLGYLDHMADPLSSGGLPWSFDDALYVEADQFALLTRAFREAVRTGDMRHFRPRRGQLRPMVDVRRFVEDPAYMGQRGHVRPRLLDTLEELFHGPRAAEHLEVALGGAIGWGKSYFAEMGVAYLLYVLSCYGEPELEFGLAPGSGLYFVFQSLRLEQARKVLFDSFARRLRASPYFRRHFPPAARITSELRFPGNVCVLPLSAAQTAAVGLNVYGGVLDELNFMARVERSRRTRFSGEAEYDQAQALYTSLARRIKSRFNRRGRVPGKLFLISSAHYPGDFMDRLFSEAREQSARGEHTVFPVSFSLWEVLPPERVSSEVFYAEAGDAGGPSRILGDPSEARDPERVHAIPMDYHPEFSRDPDAAFRDLVGIPIGGSDAFLRRPEDIRAAMEGFAALHPRQLFTRDAVELSRLPGGVEGLAELLDPEVLEHLRETPGAGPWACHVDLALRHDSCALALARVAGVRRGPASLPGLSRDPAALAPEIVVDGVLEIVAPARDEIQLGRVGDLLALLAARLPLAWVTADQFQSTALLQRMRGLRNAAGSQVRAAMVSVDASTAPYQALKEGLREGRVLLPPVDKLERELRELCFDERRQRIDHPVGGSKDLADAVAGSVHVAALRLAPGAAGVCPGADRRAAARRRIHS